MFSLNEFQYSRFSYKDNALLKELFELLIIIVKNQKIIYKF